MTPMTAAGRLYHDRKHGAPNSHDKVWCGRDESCALVRDILAIEREAADAAFRVAAAEITNPAPSSKNPERMTTEKEPSND